MLRIISNLKNKRGFTLIELIVVLAVLAIILAIAVPRFIGIQKQARIDADYSTGALIAKAAELADARAKEDEIYDDAQDLIEGDFLSDLQFQSETLKGVDASEVTVSIDERGAAKVIAEVGDDDYQLYPRPTTGSGIIEE